MGWDVQSPVAVEKERIRAEIENQVQQFLQKGGHIDVLDEGASSENRYYGSIWENLNDEIGQSR